MKRVAVASERPPKLEAVRRALLRLASVDAAWIGAEIVARSTGSGVRATPLSDAELRRGAAQRAHALQDDLRVQGDEAALYLGLEGGLHVEHAQDGGRVWLRSWAYAWDGIQGAWGCGPSLQLPVCVADPVVRGEDLAVVIDRVAGAADLRSQGGTWGWVTRGLIARADAFEAAVLAAMARFYNPEAYSTD